MKILNNNSLNLVVELEYKLGGDVSESGFVRFYSYKGPCLKNAGDAISYLALGEWYCSLLQEPAHFAFGSNCTIHKTRT